MQTPSAAWQRFKRESLDYTERARSNRLSRLGVMGAPTPATPLRADLGHWLGSPAQAPARPVKTPAPLPGASPARELELLRARISELEAGGTPSALAPEARKRKETTAMTRIGVTTEGGKVFELGKKRFDVLALVEALTSMGVDPAQRCPQWLLCHGEGAGRARAECPDYALHSAGGDWHTPVPKLKTSLFDISRTPEERDAIKERNLAARTKARPGAGKAKPGK